MSAVLKSEVHLEPLNETLLAAVLQVEKRAYSHPWTRGNFVDSQQAGYQVQLLMGEHRLLGYFVAMEGVEEVHLLNITVAPEFQRQGWACVMLDALCVWSRGRGAHRLWLEVRKSNTRATEVYRRYGFHLMGERKNYYPAHQGQREDALVMSLQL